MKSNAVVIGSAAAALVLVPLVLIWYSRRSRDDKKDRMDERQVVRKKKEKIVKTTEISKEDVRFVIGRKGCVIKDIEGRCGVKVSFPESTDREETAVQIVSIKGDCNDDITEAIEMIMEACQLKPKIITEQVEIRAEFCGKIIGKGGDNLQGIRETSGTRILITKEPVNGNADMRLCSIEGTREEIDIAKEMIDSDIMTEIEIRHRRKHKQAIKDYKTYEKASNGNIAPLQSRECAEGIALSEVPRNKLEQEVTPILETLANIKSSVSPSPQLAQEHVTMSVSEEDVLPILEANAALSSLVKEAVAPVLEDVPRLVKETVGDVQDAGLRGVDVQLKGVDVEDIEVQIESPVVSQTMDPCIEPTGEQELVLPTVTTDTQPITACRPTELPISEEPIKSSLAQKIKETQRQINKLIEPIKQKLEEGKKEVSAEPYTGDNTGVPHSTSVISRDLATTEPSRYTLDSTSTGFTIDSNFSYDLCSSDSIIHPVAVKLEKEYDAPATLDNAPATLDDAPATLYEAPATLEYEDEITPTGQEDLTPTSGTDTPQLPINLVPLPISSSQDIGSDSIETLVPGTPPNSMLLSGLSHVSSGESVASSVVNNTLTLHLKSMLGIQSSNSKLSTKGHTVPVHAEIRALLDNTVNTALDISHSLQTCSVHTFTNTKTSFPDEFEGVITSALCRTHLWVMRKHTLTVLQKMFTSAKPTEAVETIKINERYLFVNQVDNKKYRLQATQELSSEVTECFDIDTGLELSVPANCLYRLPNELSLIPPAAVCVSIGSEHCDKVLNSELIGKAVTVLRIHMGAKQDIKYPRVKLHCGDQVVLNNNYRYVPSPHTCNSNLPPGSSLVYVSAIHNAGHFYVQVCGKNISELDRLETAMANHYGSVDTSPDYSWTPVTGQLCGVWHTSEQIWLRGQVKELDNSNMLYIKYLDYGDTVHVPRSYIRKLKPEFKDVPYQAIECFLANTIPITTRQWTPDATAKFDALTRCGQWYPLRCVVVGERHGKPHVELYDQPYSDKEYSVGESLCAMDYARSSKLEKPTVQTLSTPIPSFASGAAYLVSPDFDDVDDELEELFACDDDSDSADSDDFPVSRANVSNILMSLTNQLSPGSAQWCKNTARYRPQTCGTAKNNAFMERPESTDSENNSSDPATPKARRKMRSFKAQESLSEDSDNLSESDQSYFQTPLGTSPKSTTSSYASAAEFSTTFVPAEHTSYHDQSAATPLHLSSAEDTDCG